MATFICALPEGGADSWGRNMVDTIVGSTEGDSLCNRSLGSSDGSPEGFDEGYSIGFNNMLSLGTGEPEISLLGQPLG